MSAPVLAEQAGRVYQQLAPIARQDSQYGYPFAHLVAALMGPIEQAALWTADNERGTGYGDLLDLNTAPYEALPFLGLYNGIIIVDGTPDDEARRLIGEARGLHAGSLGDLISDVKTTLIGAQAVRVYPRVPGPWEVEVVTRTSETPDPTATQAAASNAARKPAGLKIAVSQSDLPFVFEYTRLMSAITVHLDVATVADVT